MYFRRLLILSLCLLFASLISGQTAFCAGEGRPTGWVNALKPKGIPGQELTLASHGKAKYDILLPAKPTTMEEKAAADLAEWLRQMTDGKFRIVYESGRRMPGKVISVGMTQLLKEANPWQLGTNLANEGYAVAIKDGNLFLFGGKTRGVINAVYALLEEDLGCRWYDRLHESIPHVRELKFRPLPRKYVPQLEVRDIYHRQAFDRDWSLRNRLNSNETKVPEEWGGEYDSAMFVHTYNQLMPPKEFFKDHPEYFSELDGKLKPQQLCLTNPDVLRIMTERVKERLRKKPYSEEISVSPNDLEDYCTCANCRAIDEAEGSHAGTLIKFCNAIAEQIEKEFPEVKISTLAYLGTYKPPKTIKPRHNVTIQLCTDHHTWGVFLKPLTASLGFQRAMKSWHGMDADMHIWDYVVNFSHHINPTPNTETVNYAIKWYMRHGASGVMLQGHMSSYGSDNVTLKNWIWGKLLWDHTLDETALMKDFVYGYYGDAAEPMWDYNQLMLNKARELDQAALRSTDKEYRDIGIRFPPDAFWLTSEFLDSLLSCIARAESMANDPIIMQRVKAQKLPALYARISQELGYVNNLNEKFVPGKIFADEKIDTEERARCTAMLDELESIVKAEHIKYFFETAPDANDRIKQWRDKLEG